MSAGEGQEPTDPLGGGSDAYRIMSRAAMDQMVDAKVEAKLDLAMAEYFSSLDVPAIWDTIKKHDKALFGNGRPGLVEEMAVIRPIESKLEEHLKAFRAFETQTMVDRQSFFGRFDTIEKKVDDGLASLAKSIEPFTKIWSVAVKGGVAIGFFAFLAGGILVFLFEHFDKILEILKWLKTIK